MIPTLEEIEALPPALFTQLRRDVMCVSTSRIRRERRGLPRNSLAAKLSRMAVGDSVMFETWSCTDKLGSLPKQGARRRMGNPIANWTARLTNHGVRVTRIR